MNTNIITYKIPYFLANDSEKVQVSFYLKQYNNLFRYTYNRLLDNPKLKTKEITVLQKQMKNVDLMDSWFKSSTIFDAKTLLSSTSSKKVIFGGKQNFLLRCQNKISKEEFKEKRLVPLFSIGESTRRGNRKFQLLTDSQILFKPNRKTHICLNLQSMGKKRSKDLQKLIDLQNNCQLPITYKLDKNFVYLTFDYNFIKQNTYSIKENRILAIDINPNYLGYSVVDWKDELCYNIIDKGLFDIKHLNDKQKNLKVTSSDKKTTYLNNKRDYEIIQIAYYLAKLAKHYHCELFSIENLSIKSKNLSKGRKLNRLVNNQWNRHKFIGVLKKLINSSSTKLIEVEPQFSSFIGNLTYRNERLPDPILASIELGRRAYEFNLQYIKKTKNTQKNIIFPNLERVKYKVLQSLEELQYNVPFRDLKELYYTLKNSKKRYRVSLEEINSERVFSKFYSKRLLFLHTFV